MTTPSDLQTSDELLVEHESLHKPQSLEDQTKYDSTLKNIMSIALAATSALGVLTATETAEAQTRPTVIGTQISTKLIGDIGTAKWAGDSPWTLAAYDEYLSWSERNQFNVTLGLTPVQTKKGFFSMNGSIRGGNGPNTKTTGGVGFNVGGNITPNFTASAKVNSYFSGAIPYVRVIGIGNAAFAIVNSENNGIHLGGSIKFNNDVVSFGPNIAVPLATGCGKGYNFSFKPEVSFNVAHDPNLGWLSYVGIGAGLKIGETPCSSNGQFSY